MNRRIALREDETARVRMHAGRLVNAAQSFCCHPERLSDLIGETVANPRYHEVPEGAAKTAAYHARALVRLAASRRVAVADLLYAANLADEANQLRFLRRGEQRS